MKSTIRPYVSILVFLEPLLRLLRLRVAGTPGPVSILVFLEPLLRQKALRYLLSEMMFQSLFFWNHYLDPAPGILKPLKELVSILVFLEPLLRQERFHLII